ncbi:BadF/BadG/BcrA/BcrD ATPase family protein [Paucibacter sp. APW11]|uniref:BadF/BadG/BcrA/BcrD ATPase family protein n=1 Tax=Roseateles aquae TaxID=3077235 RepID=A0ABU3PC81_9BURK|nr:BadF/BadG/BcrA/BcrD ATPase family protein [Paucibacter sp. APW11]MDT8999937.1 BadF/BadG/BcrA/BcrD ATPase family protein [Paucibacter sp. APW11]
MISIAPDRSLFADESALQAVRYLVGVDGGGTGTRLRLSDLDGRLLGQGEAGPSALGQGVDQAWRHIEQALQQAAEQAGLAGPQGLRHAECALAAGLSGANLPAACSEFLASQPGYAAVIVVNDGYTTVLGAHGGQPGAVVASGTGAVGEVLRRDGSTDCISGWGWITGDEGSGAWLGLKAIRHAQQALDGRAVPGPLAFAVWDLTGRSRESVLAWCAAAGQHGFAQLAPLVFMAADKGDAVAQRFVDEAVTELEALARALDPQSELPLALAGSIAKRLESKFSGNIRARCVEPQGDSADGALHLVRSALNAKMGSR